MSNKFEQLLDLLVNEEMDKANELFHEIVVEKSREIYENMIAEEAEVEEEIDEEMDDNDLDEGQDEAVEEETTLEIGGDSGDDFVSAVSDKDAMGGMDDMGGNDSMDGDLGDEGGGSDEQRISDLESELEQLKAEFEQLMAGEEDEPEHDDMFGGSDSDEDDEEEPEEEPEEDDDEESKEQYMREYVEMVKDGHGADKKGRAESADNTRSVGLQNPKGRPTTTASAHNILGGKGGEAGIKGGEGLVGGQKGEFTKDHLNKPGGFKGDAMKKNSAGHGAEKKGAGEGAAYTKSPADRMQ
jgi:hypothetical protein